MRYGLITTGSQPSVVTDDPTELEPFVALAEARGLSAVQSIYGYPCICGGYVSEWIAVDELGDPVEPMEALCSDACVREAWDMKQGDDWS